MRTRPTILACVLASIGVARALADQVVLTPSRDNTMYEYDPVFGEDLSNGSGASIFCGKTAQGFARRALIRFDFSQIPPGATIVRVELHLRMLQTIAGETPVSLRRVNADWGEGGSVALGSGGGGAPAQEADATWRHRFYDATFWATPGGDFNDSDSGTIGVNAEGEYIFPTSDKLVGDVRHWIASPAENFGWVLLGDETAPATAKRFGSREDALNPPRLVIDFTPAPACDADYNQDGSPDLSDIFDLAQDIAAGTASFPPNSPDFNADGSSDLTDILDMANVVAGGNCP